MSAWAVDAAGLWRTPSPIPPGVPHSPWTAGHPTSLRRLTTATTAPATGAYERVKTNSRSHCQSGAEQEANLIPGRMTTPREPANRGDETWWGDSERYLGPGAAVSHPSPRTRLERPLLHDSKHAPARDAAMLSADRRLRDSHPGSVGRSATARPRWYVAWVLRLAGLRTHATHQLVHLLGEVSRARPPSSLDTTDLLIDGITQVSCVADLVCVQREGGLDGLPDGLLGAGWAGVWVSGARAEGADAIGVGRAGVGSERQPGQLRLGARLPMRADDPLSLSPALPRGCRSR